VIRLFLLLAWITSLSAEVYPVDITPSDINQTIGTIKILDQKEIILDNINGIRFAEASDLAYDAKADRLYMIGDKGSLYVFALHLGEKIDTLSPLEAYPITKARGKRFKSKKIDTEGLALDDKGRLLISFERKPKIGAFDTRGRRMVRYTLPQKIRNPKHYRSRNKMLESVAYHPRYGILTASELPLKKKRRRAQTIYSLKGKQWHFLAEPERRSAVTAIEVMDDGNLLILERAYTKPAEPRYTTLKKLYLNRCKQGLCETKTLAKMNSALGWRVDNFEGLTHVAPHRYLMISDDNANFFQRTLLIYFEVLE
jgi:hypothetical protein